MPGNPFHAALDDVFRSKRVRVHTAAHTYEGWCRIWHYNEYGIVLEDATRDDGQHLSAVVVHDPQTVERLTDAPAIERVPVDAIHPSPYNAREYDDVAIASFAREIRDHGQIPASDPVVRPIDEGEYEIVSGHRRLAAVRQVGWDTLPVRVVDLDDWAATRRFVAEHVPLPTERPSASLDATDADEQTADADADADGAEDEPDTTDADEPTERNRGWYTEAEIDQLVERLQTDWSTERLRELVALRPDLE